MTTFQNVWPVNELGEIVAATGVGSSSVTGFVNQDQIPVDSIGKVKIAGMAQLATDAAGMVHVLKSRSSPSSGVALVTGTTTEQFFELADLSSLLRVDDAVTVDITLAYTGSTNGKYITYYLGPDTSSLTSLAGTTRTSGTEVSMRAMSEFFVQDMNSVGRISSALGVIGPSATAVSSLSVDVGQPSLKLYIGLKLASAAEQIAVHKYAVLLQRSN